PGFDLKRVTGFDDGHSALAGGEIDITIRRDGGGVVFAFGAEAFLFEKLLAGLRIEATDAAAVLRDVNAATVEQWPRLRRARRRPRQLLQCEVRREVFRTGTPRRRRRILLLPHRGEWLCLFLLRQGRCDRHRSP